MDIGILLALQEFRDGPGASLAEFLAKMTFLGELNTVLVVMAIIYWCVWKELGSYLLLGWAGNRLVNGALKVTACTYRPWIRDARIVPYGDAITTATGYSFPSGHIMNAITAYGGGMVRSDLPKALRITLGIIVALVGFSRLFLGVHTPQDVLVGAAAGLLVMWLTLRLVRWVNCNPENDWKVVCAGIATALLIAIYATFKPYPMDLDDAGNLLVDGMKMANDTFKGVGWCAGILIGWLLERRYVKFSTDVRTETKLTRAAIGLLCYYILSLILIPLVKTWVLGPAGTVTTCFMQTLYVTFLLPWLMARLECDSIGQVPSVTG